MAALPPIRESALGSHNRIRLSRDHYVRVDTCGYSVDPAVIGQMVDVRVGLDQVTVTREGRFAGALVPPGQMGGSDRPGLRQPSAGPAPGGEAHDRPSANR